MEMDLLRKVSEAPGISGFEYGIAEIIKRELEGCVDKIEEDAFGNLYAHKGKGSKTIMITAHTDEIGLIVKHIDEKGFIRFAKVGGVPDHVLLGQRVQVHGRNKRLSGTIGCKAIHVMKEDERKQLVTYDKMFVDTGATKDQLVKYGVRVGTPITVERGVTELENGLIVGRAMDDRAGCYMLMEALKKANPVNRIVAVFTVQEEVGLRGATVSSFLVRPDLGVAIDTTIAGDHPEIGESEAPVKLGAGPVLVVADGRRDSLGGGLIANPMVVGWLTDLAERLNIRCQFEVLEGGTTDAAAIQLSREGVPSGCIAIPARYVHSFSEVVSKSDIESGVRLLSGIMENPVPI
ncbi:MAG: M42 family metallopeptidase [Candidatus Verstraetearchaeota archaeon]|nr:M42 family metallopeptidase [Candidatus Verstraetearchaeota archaeon]